VAALVVGDADGARGLAIVAHQAVEQAALAHAGGPDEDHGAARGDLRAQTIHAVAGGGAGHQAGHAGGDRGDGLHDRLAIGRQVGLVEHDHRARAAGLHGGQVALEAPGAEVGARRGHDEDDVHVDGHDLRLGQPGAPAAQPGRSRQHVADDRVATGGLDGDPVAHRGPVVGTVAAVKAPGQLGVARLRAQQGVDPVMFRRHPRRDQRGVAQVLQLLLALGRPTQTT
jgi:hypothetical protein